MKGNTKIGEDVDLMAAVVEVMMTGLIKAEEKVLLLAMFCVLYTLYYRCCSYTTTFNTGKPTDQSSRRKDRYCDVYVLEVALNKLS